MNILLILGRALGGLGALICLVSIATRLSGTYWLGGFQVNTLLQGGVAAIVIGSFCLLVVLTKNR